MKVLGNDIYIQRGENWSLDLDITNKNGDPYMIFSGWKNPYLAITVTAALYEQKGDFRQTYWLDLNQRWEEQDDGSIVLKPMKKFISTEALNIGIFAINEVLGYYGTAVGGKIVLDQNSDFDVKNYLFFTSVENDVRTYKYVKEYTLDADGNVEDEVWEEYNFRFIKQFDTKDWMEQGYLFDMKLLAGDTVEEYVYDILVNENFISPKDLPWSDADLEGYIEKIEDEKKRLYVREIYESGAPLMPNYDTKGLILNPTRLYVSVNLQGGVR
jgi:hypothetical protein